MTLSSFNQVWADEQLAPWRKRPVDPAVTLSVLHALNRSHDLVVLFDIDRGHVRVVEKGHEFVGWSSERIGACREMIGEAATMFPNIATTLAIYLGDGAPPRDDVPMLAFQKPRGAKPLLFPDTDFATTSYFALDKHRDDLCYVDKNCSAVFVGSTTGGRLITLDMVRNLQLQRLRSAVYFQGDPKVDFRLSKIVQCESEAVAEEIRSLGFGQGLCAWKDQLGHKFLLSMDGNAATWSRVPLALKSNSVLMKYESDSVLYYYGGLVPWTHYIPIHDDSEVRRYIDLEENSPGTYASIATEGRRFYEEHLRKVNILDYIGRLICGYAELMAGRPMLPATTAFALPPAPGDAAAGEHGPASRPRDVAFRLIGHMAFEGDVTSDRDGWIGHRGGTRPIEGFVLETEDEALEQALSYRAWTAEGEWSAWCGAGQFCGTRALSRPLLGVAFRLGSSRPIGARLGLATIFADGSQLDVVGDREVVCLSTKNASIVALRLHIDRRERFIGSGVRQCGVAKLLA